MTVRTACQAAASLCPPPAWVTSAEAWKRIVFPPGLVMVNHPTPAAVLLIVLGGGLGVLTPVAWGVLQEVAPSHMLGRVLAFYTLGAMAAAMGGITLFGWITGQFGVPVAVAAIGIVMGGTGLSAWGFLNHVFDRPVKREPPSGRDHT